MEKGSVKILLMRHAESMFNKMQSETSQLQGVNRHNIISENRWIINDQLVDSLLSPEGVVECQDAQKVIPSKFPAVKYVIASPVRRALLTALLSFKDYPTNLEYSIEPWAREILNSQCDIACYSPKMLKEYPHIDSSVLKDDPLWFLDYYVDNPEQNYAPRLREAYAKAPNVETIVEFFKQNFPKLESHIQMKARDAKLKASLAKFIQLKQSQGIQIGDGEIVLVSHSRTLSQFIG